MRAQICSLSTLTRPNSPSHAVDRRATASLSITLRSLRRRSDASTKIFVNLLSQFYLNNAANFHQWTSQNTTSCRTMWRSYRDHRLLWRHFTLCTKEADWVNGWPCAVSHSGALHGMSSWCRRRLYQRSRPVQRWPPTRRRPPPTRSCRQRPGSDSASGWANSRSTSNECPCRECGRKRARKRWSLPFSSTTVPSRAGLHRHPSREWSSGSTRRTGHTQSIADHKFTSECVIERC